MSHYGLNTKTYRVSIAAAGLGGAAPADGFIDNTKVSEYVAAGGTLPATVALHMAKERGNSRFQTLVWALNNQSNASITNIVATGGAADTAPTVFQFDVTFERGDDAIANEGQTSDAAVTRIVARALMVARMDRTDYFDPTQSAAKGDNAPNQAARRLDVVDDLAVAALTASLSTAETAITVTAL